MMWYTLFTTAKTWRSGLLNELAKIASRAEGAVIVVKKHIQPGKDEKTSWPKKA